VRHGFLFVKPRHHFVSLRRAAPIASWSGWRTRSGPDWWLSERSSQPDRPGPHYVRCRSRGYLERRGRMAIPVDGYRRGTGRSCGHGRHEVPAQQSSGDPIVPDLPRPAPATDDAPRDHPTRRGRAGKLRAGGRAAGQPSRSVSASDERLRLSLGRSGPGSGRASDPHHPGDIPPLDGGHVQVANNRAVVAAGPERIHQGVLASGS